MNDPINQLYDNIYQRLRLQAGAYNAPDLRFRASEAADCWRRMYYRVGGWKPAPVSPELDMMGTKGSVDHDVVRQLCAYYSIDIGGIITDEQGNTDETIQSYCDVTVDTSSGSYPVSIGFRADGEIETPRGLCLLEVKGMGYSAYYHLEKAFEAGGNDAAVERVKTKIPRYYWQMMLSIYLANNFLGKKYKYAYFMPYDRSHSNLGVGKLTTAIDKLTGTLSVNNKRTGIYIPYDENIVEHILQRFALIVRRVREENPPSQEYSEGSYECLGCPYLYACHAADSRRAKGLEPVIIYPERESVEA